MLRNLAARFGSVIGFFMLFLAAAPLTSAQGTYYTNSDNENNANTHISDNDMDVSLGNANGRHPIEFNIMVTTLPQTSAVLTMYNLDVDEEQGEIDLVYFNGHLLGKLTGANDVWSSTAFVVDPAWVVQGRNLVRIEVDTSGDSTPWVTTSDWGQLLIDGGGAVNGDTQGVQITGTSVNAGNVTINTSTFVHSISGGNYRLQISLIAPNGDAITVLSEDFAVAAGADVTRTTNPVYPLANASGTYTVQAQLFWLDPAQSNFPVQQDMAIAYFDHTVGVGAGNFNNDSDGDGLLDSTETTLGTDPNDPDTDNDGASDSVEVGANPGTPVDTDGDGVIDALDATNNNPCAPNANAAACLAADSDGDGLTNAQEDTLGTGRNTADTDGDGSNDGTETVDSDGDGVIDALESSLADTDGDGVSNQLDVANGNPCVPNANSTPCLAADSDGDGLTNAQEDALGTSRGTADSDGDGTTDAAEVGGNVNAPVDTDGDGIPNVLESSVVDSDGDGIPNQADPANSNACVPNANSAACRALDSDGDGLTNGQEDALGTSRGTADSDGDGTPDAVEVGGNVNAPVDSDGDGIPNVLESSAVDSDGDGVANQADSANNDACVPNANSAACLAVDSDGDGLTNGEEDALGTDRHDADSDGDGVPDGADVDSDNDGIADSVEGTTDTDGDGTPDSQDRDSDGDGLPDALEGSADSDLDGTPDYLDTDSDNDTLPDALESSASGSDTDSDGIDDAFDADTLGDGDINHDGVGDSAVPLDRDGDGAPDYLDVDSDGDGILDSFEGTPTALTDTDADGAPDVHDLDSDNDGLSDARESAFVDVDGDSMMDAGQAPTANPRDSDGDGIPNFRDLDSNADGTPDIAGSGHASLDANGDGRIDAGVDSDGDGIRDQADTAPQVFGTVIDGDGDGVPDVADLDLDNDGIPNDADGSDDTDGDGQPNLADLDSDGDGSADLVEAGGVDSDDNGLADNFVDTNGNGISDAFEPSRGGTTLPVPDSDSDGVNDHRDLDSDGDGLSDVIESGGADANNDGRLDAGAPKPSMPDSDGDGMRDLLDTDSDNDSIPDSREGRGDSDADGIPDSLDNPGNLQTAIRGTGAFEPLSLLGLLALMGWLVMQRLGGRVRMARVLPAAACVLLGAQGFEARAADVAAEGWYLGFDAGMSRVEPRNEDGGYVVDDKQDLGYRINLGYSWSPSWSGEVFYADGGKAGIASDNPAVGHLGDISYTMYGAGVEWAPLEKGRKARWFPIIKLGAVQIRNEASSPYIQYEKLNDLGVYLGGGMGLRLGNSWMAQGEVVSYDQDELFFTLGVRKRF